MIHVLPWWIVYVNTSGYHDPDNDNDDDNRNNNDCLFPKYESGAHVPCMKDI